jgi:hypothetical protein
MSRLARCLTVVVAAMVLALGVGQAEAVQTAVMDFEFLAGADNLKCQSPHDECDAIVAANEVSLGLPAGSIELIGKLATPGATFSELQSPFNGAGVDLNPSWTCDASGCAVQLDFSDLGFDWQIVKIVAKAGWGNFGATEQDGVFVRSNPLSGQPVDDIQRALITADAIEAWFDAANLPENRQNVGRFSHIWIFGVRSEQTVPEPTTLLLLGLGLAGLSTIARRR